MLAWPIRIASVVALFAISYGWADFALDPYPEAAILLAILTIALVAILSRLYRPGGLASFDDGSPRRAPGEAVPDM
ncbi:MAG TPA: hypothetical protein VF533_15550, partial [Solirubrobacteraceae bacterium]